MLIVLSGQGRSGKDTAAKILGEILGNNFTVAYADYLKDIVRQCFNLTEEQLYGLDKESPIEELSIRTRSGHVTTHSWTPRKLFQYLGTDVFRTINPDCWVNVVKQQVDLAHFDNYIITDGRFPNEIDWVLERGGIHIRLDRTDKDFVSGTDHESETSLTELVPGHNSFIIHNNKDLDYLRESLLKIVNTWRNK